MARLIDADALYKEIKRIYDEHYCNSSYQFIHDFFRAILRRIGRVPTVDAVPVVHGRWITDEKGVTYCVRCRIIDDYASVHNYCPNCGANMDLEV